MPELVIASTSTTPSAPVPVQALQPSMRILKRPSASPSPSSPPTADAAAPKSLAEREAQYRAARDRIFGTGGTSASAAAGASSSAGASAENGSAAPSTPSASPASSPPLLQQPSMGAKPIRHPRGPDATPRGEGDSSQAGAGASRGFSRRGANANPQNASSRGRSA